jgi:hypothetical protein
VRPAGGPCTGFPSCPPCTSLLPPPQDFGAAVHGTPEAAYGPAGQLDALRVAVLQASALEPETGFAMSGPAVGGGGGGGAGRAGGLGFRPNPLPQLPGGGNGTAGGGGGGNGTAGGGGNGTAGGGRGPGVIFPYVPYAQRVLFSNNPLLVNSPYPFGAPPGPGAALLGSLPHGHARSTRRSTQAAQGPQSPPRGVRQPFATTRRARISHHRRPRTPSCHLARSQAFTSASCMWRPPTRSSQPRAWAHAARCR